MSVTSFSKMFMKSSIKKCNYVIFSVSIMNNRRYRSYDSNSHSNNSLLGAAPMGRQDTGFNTLTMTQQLQQQQMNLLREQQKQLAMAMNLGQIGGLHMQSQGLGMGMLGMAGINMGNFNMDRNNDRRSPRPLLDGRHNPMRRGSNRGARQSYQSRSQGGYGVSNVALKE